MRAVASAEPDLDGRLCVAGVVAGTAELQDAVFAHRRLIGFDGQVDERVGCDGMRLLIRKDLRARHDTMYSLGTV